MYICICNPFTDHDVTNHLKGLGEKKTSVKKTYAACSGAEKMNCGSCACEIKKIVDMHNQNITVNELSKKMSVLILESSSA